MAAKDVGDLQGGTPHESLCRVQILQGADDLAQDVGGDLRIERRGIEPFVAKQNLDDTDIDLLLKQMGCEAVPQGVH